jgi:hypothetical protein
LELRSELTISHDFAFVTSDFESEFLDGQLALGGGITLASNLRFERYGAQALAEYRGEHVTAGLGGSFAPRQERRGWVSLDPHMVLRFALARWSLHGETGLLLRQVDALHDRSPCRGRISAVPISDWWSPSLDSRSNGR